MSDNMPTQEQLDELARTATKKDKERQPDTKPKPEPEQIEMVHGISRKRKAPHV